MLRSSSSHPQLPKRKGGLYVSTVSIVCARAERLRGLARIHIDSNRQRRWIELSNVLLKRFGSTIADPTDGTDGTDVIFRRSAYPDYSGSGSAFTTERNVNAKRPKKCLRPTQVPSQGARIFYPPGAVACLRAAFNANPQKIRGAARPRATLAHEFPNARNDRVGIDDTLNRVLAVGRVGASESASGPECRFAGRGPERKIRHTRQLMAGNGIYSP
jgi:hypothetical protein